MRESRTYGSVRGARDETRVPTATMHQGTAVPRIRARGNHRSAGATREGGFGPPLLDGRIRRRRIGGHGWASESVPSIGAHFLW